MNLKLTRLAVIGGLLTSVSGLQAAPFLYTNSTDVMLCFRKVQRNGGTSGAYDYEINIGRASRFYTATGGSSFAITQFTAGQLNSIFDDLNNTSWSVAGASPDGDGTAPAETLWVTKKRTNLSVQSTPPTRKGFANHQAARTYIDSVGDNAVQYSGLPTTPADGTNNTVTTVRIPEGSGQNYSTFVGSTGTFPPGFWSDVENTTPSDFTTAGLPSRVDLYELRVGSGPGTYLGYFDLSPAGTVTFTAPSVTPPAPTITSITSSGGTNVISFTTVSGANYNLRFTNSLTAPAASWPVIPNVASGDGTVKSVTDVSSDAVRYYRIEAHP